MSITFGANFTAGTQFNFDATRAAGTRWAVGSTTTGLSDSTSSNFALNASGENLFAYNGTTAPVDGASVSWVAAFASNPFLTTGSSSASLTYLPSAFTGCDTAFSLGLASGSANQNGAMTTQPQSVVRQRRFARRLTRTQTGKTLYSSQWSSRSAKHYLQCHWHRWLEQ